MSVTVSDKHEVSTCFYRVSRGITFIQSFKQNFCLNHSAWMKLCPGEAGPRAKRYGRSARCSSGAEVDHGDCVIRDSGVTALLAAS